MPLTRNDIDARVIPKFFEYTEKRGYTPSLEKYLERKDTPNPLKFILAPQVTAIKEYLHLVFSETRGTISISWTRQLGKTEIFSQLDSFCLEYFYEYLKKPFPIVVLAPEKETGTVLFDRTCEYVSDGFFNKKSRGLRRENSRGDGIEVFSLYEDGGSTFEGRTIKSVKRDEAHLGSDKKFADQVRPTMIRTSGVLTNIGNGGYKDCLFYRSLEKGSTTDTIQIGGKQAISKNIVIRRDYNQLKAYMIEMAEQGVTECFDWVHGVEQEILDLGINSIEVRKNIFCQWILTVEGFVSEEEVKNKVVSCQWDQKSDILMGIDFAKHIDRTIAMFATPDMQVFDLVILKDCQERKDVMQQLSELRDYCDDKGYTDHIALAGGDATGMGEVAVELMAQEFPCEIIEYKFTARDKHKWYTNLQSRILTSNDKESLTISDDLNFLDGLIHELTSLQVKPSNNGEYLQFAAPSKTGEYDDTVASLALTVDLVSRYKGYISDARPYQSPKKKGNPAQRPELIKPKNSPFIAKNNSYVSGY